MMMMMIIIHCNTVKLLDLFVCMNMKSLIFTELISLRDERLFLDGGCQLMRTKLQCITDCRDVKFLRFCAHRILRRINKAA